MQWILFAIFFLSFQVQANTAEMPLAAGLTSVEIASNELATPILESPAALENPKTPTAAEISTKNLKEDEILVNLEATKKVSAAENPLLRFFFSICIVGILGFGAFYLIRKYRFGNPKSQATQIKVLSQHFLGPKKSLAIIRVAGESILVGITDHNISMIKSLSLLDEDIPEETPKEFHSVFGQARKNQTAEEAEKQNEKDAESREDFSISGIKDFVSLKMKNMRSLE
jgi:flagellar protein FliO/FliZ